LSPVSGSDETVAICQPGAEAIGKTLWMREMEPWMDENFIKQVYQAVLIQRVFAASSR
jgi:hypothetical protein